MYSLFYSLLQGVLQQLTACGMGITGAALLVIILRRQSFGDKLFWR